MAELSLPENIIPLKPKLNKIVFISDLHFDFTRGKFKAKAAPRMKDDFIAFIKEQYTESLLCLAGDIYNDYRKTLRFVKELEENKIVGFFVLGNHDFWNNGMIGYQDIIRLFDEETQGNLYFRFLFTGRKYYIDDICFIGDTGWTSFQRGKRRVALKTFLNLPDAVKVKDFSPKKIVAMHEEWISFANSILDEEKKVMIITHFPMVDLTHEDRDCWWSSKTELKGDNSWRIFGHTHKYKEQQNNNVSSQRGYDNRDYDDLQLTGRQYSSTDFCILEKVIDHKVLAVPDNYKMISKYYSPLRVSNAIGESGLLSTIKRRGFKRCSANKRNFAVLANSPETYLEWVKEATIGYLGDTYIGFCLSSHISKDIIESIFSSIAILENGDYNDIRAFITAAVITGYVFNRMIFFLPSMRPLDDYDIMRFWLMFLTMKKCGVNLDSVDTVRTNKKSHIEFCNVDIYLPAINGYSLEIGEVQKLMQQTPLLPRPVELIEQANLRLIEKRTETTRYYLTFIYMGLSYAVHKSSNERLYFVSMDVDKTCQIIYRLTLDDNSPNILLLKKSRHKSLFEYIIDEYRWEHVRFENVGIKEAFLEVIKMYDCFRNGYQGT